MKICGACERELPEESYREEQRGLRQSSRRCEECIAAGIQLVLMRKGRARSEEEDCPICSLPLPLDWKQSSFKACCMKIVCNGCALASGKCGMEDCPFCRTPDPDDDSMIAKSSKGSKNELTRVIQLPSVLLESNIRTDGSDWRRTWRGPSNCSSAPPSSGKKTRTTVLAVCMIREWTWRRTLLRRSDITRQQR